MTHDQIDRRETFLFVSDEEGLDAAIEATFAAGVEWARTHLGFVHRSRGQIHRREVSVIAAELGYTADDLCKHSRHDTKLNHARHIAAWLLRHRNHLSYPAIGQALHRDHSTIHRSARVVESSPDLLARAREHDAKLRDSGRGRV